MLSYYCTFVPKECSVGLQKDSFPVITVHVHSYMYPFCSDSQTASSHLVSAELEVTCTESVCAEDAMIHEQSAASQKSHMDQQMSTALHGKILSTVCKKRFSHFNIYTIIIIIIFYKISL